MNPKEVVSRVSFAERAAIAGNKSVDEILGLRGDWDIRLFGPDGRLKQREIGRNVICQAGKNQILLYTGAEYLNQFGYLAIGANSLAITNATNATPIVITTASSYGLYNGAQVTISGVGGNTAANGTYYAKTAGYTGTTFGLYSNSALTTGVAGNGAYTSSTGTVVLAAANALDTVLFDQLAISSLVTPTNPSAGTLQFVYTFGAGVGTGAIAECGAFDAASSGNLISHILFAVVNKGSGDSLQLTYQFS